MKISLFEFPSYQYEIDDWEFKKKALLKRINRQKFIRTNHQYFETDRQTNNKVYVKYFEDFLTPVLKIFCEEAQVTCGMSDAWCVRYQKGDHQSVHNHRGWGFSGVLYVEYDEKVHTPTKFVAPWQNPSTDTTSLSSPHNIKEGSLIIFPSYGLHFVDPNTTRKPRTIISFDLLPELPQHQSLNKNV